MANDNPTASLVPGSRFSTHEALYALAQDLCLTYPITSGRKDAALARGYIALDALLAAAQAANTETLAALKTLCADYEMILGAGITASNEPAILRDARAAIAKATT